MPHSISIRFINTSFAVRYIVHHLVYVVASINRNILASEPRVTLSSYVCAELNKAAPSLVHQLAMSAQKRWRQLLGFRYLADVIASGRFTDGVDERKTGREAAGFRTAIHQI